MEKKVKYSCKECDKLQSMFIERIANAETILELMQPDSNPDYFYKAAKEHLKKYRG